MKNGAFRRFLHHKPAVISSVLLILLVLCLVLLPVILHTDPNRVEVISMNKAPSARHLLGTDSTGRDIFARLLAGGQNSLLVGVGSAVISVLIGIPLGLIAGYYRGAASSVIMRLADMFLSFPSMILVMVTVALFGTSVWSITLIIGVLGWPQAARLLAANVMVERERDYITSARTIGIPQWRILLQYILPNAISPLWTSMAFRISQAMILESGLSFLGAGIQPPEASWGNLIQAAGSLVVLTTRQWQWLPAGICLVVTIVAINFVGEGIRDALDPRLKLV